jgi:putative nucleotidyltransferase with HDIG domain
LDDWVAGAAGVAMAILIGIVGGLGLPFVIVSIVGSLAAGYAVVGLRHRWEFYRAMVSMSLAYALTILSVELISSSSPFRVAMTDSFWGVISAVGATTAAIVLLPVFERVFGLATDITLLELADLNRPTFKRMMLEANGTYHHTMVIGSLSEAAATAIGANPLLARVGAYYHDIGKVPKAEYFGENLKPGMKNPHEKLTPTMSCLILESHVREGIEMARELRLPKRVADFIPEHQGTTLMSYFFHKALEMDPGVDERDYRYPGPRPQSKETAIVMLADSVEATARSLADPSPSRIKAVVKRIIDQRAADGQLDECNLTLEDLARARDAFVPVLVGLFHGRVQYQWQKESPTPEKDRPEGGRADRNPLDKGARR